MFTCVFRRNMFRWVAIVVSVFLVLVFAENYQKGDHSLPDVVDLRFHEEYFLYGYDLQNLAWANCNTSAPIAVTKLKVQSPLLLNGSITFSVEIKVKKTIIIKDKPIESDVNITSKWDLCQLKPSSCHSDDLCKLLHDDDIFTCPTLIGKILLNDITIDMPKIPLIPEQYNITATLRQKEGQLGCIQLSFRIQRPSDYIYGVDLADDDFKDYFP